MAEKSPDNRMLEPDRFRPGQLDKASCALVIAPGGTVKVATRFPARPERVIGGYLTRGD